MFFPAKSLFRSRGDEIAVNEQRSRRVVSLRNAIFALFQIGPVRLFEGYRPFETADSENDQRSSSDTLTSRLANASTIRLRDG